MIGRVNKITLFVNNQEEAKEFWTRKCNFMVRKQNYMGDPSWLEVAPQENAGTVFVLCDKQKMQKENPNVNTCHPYVVLGTSNIAQTICELKEKGVTTGEIKQYPYGKIATFQDQDKNEYILKQY